RLLVEQVVQFLPGELADRLVRVEEAAAAEDAAVPPVHAVAGDRERALVERLAVVVQLRQVEIGDRSHALAAGTHAAGPGKRALLPGLRSTLLDRDRTGSAHGRGVERERGRRADVRRAEPAEEDAQH